jgi:hydroxymethylpyrimidine/phosphomethylpyrimidine kinase
LRNVLVVAGLDPSAGAGILADARVCAEHGVRAVGCVTATTVQDTQGVRAVTPLSVEDIGDALRALLADIEVHAVKIGMLGRVETAEVVAEALAATRAPVVWDPVMLPSRGGVPLLEGAVDRAATALLAEARVVTPNLAETAWLLGTPMATDVASMKQAASALRARGAAAVLVKGGHLPGESSPDVLDDGGELTVFDGPRRKVGPLHGTGCVLSTAIACRLALGASLVDAVWEAKHYMNQKLAEPLVVGRGASVLV